MKGILYIAVGGSIGAISRYLLSNYINKYNSISYTWGITGCNLLGCFLIGLIIGNQDKFSTFPIKQLLIIGFLGSFTTFSTFSLDAVYMLKSNEHFKFTIHLLTNVFLGIGFTYIGIAITKLFN